jgi:hypothetical protein
MKNLHTQMQNHKELLTRLQPELELKKIRKASPGGDDHPYLTRQLSVF